MLWEILFGVLILGILIPFLLELARKRASFKGKHVLITGGSKGIGLEIARGFLAKGATVTLVARNKAELQAAKDELQAGDATNGSVHVESCDVSDHKQVTAMAAAAVDVLGPVDILVCNAGLSIPGYFLDQKPEVFKKQMDVNYLGCVHAVQAVLPSMVARNSGRICFTSSGIVAGGFLGYASYAPTKFAVRALADSLRNELAGFNIPIHVAYPPDTETAGFAAENETKPEETKLITPPAAYPANVVAMGMIDSMAKGLYHLPSPLLDINLSIWQTTGTSTRRNSFFEVLLVGPIWGLAQQGWRMLHADKIAAGYAKKKLNKQM